MNISRMVRGSGQVQAPDYSAPPSRHGFGVELIFYLFFLSVAADLVACHIPSAIMTLGAAAPLVRAGKLTLLAHTASKRIADFPDWRRRWRQFR